MLEGYPGLSAKTSPALTRDTVRYMPGVLQGLLSAVKDENGHGTALRLLQNLREECVVAVFLISVPSVAEI